MSSVFISGETIDLCVPQEEDFEQWASWFNDQDITRFLEQGKFPNNRVQQRKFYETAIQDGRFLTLIKDKEQKLLGVISLSEIDPEKRSCQIAYVCPIKSASAQLAPLEALAICTQHAFSRFGVLRVWAGHAFPGLRNWIQKTEILGYKADGLLPFGFIHGSVVSHALRTSITQPRFVALVERRDGSLWPGQDKARKMLMNLAARKSLAEEIAELIENAHLHHDEVIEGIEESDC